MDGPITEILDTEIVDAIADAKAATIQLVRYRRDTGEEVLTSEVVLA